MEANFEDHNYYNQRAKGEVLADLRKHAGYNNGKLFAKEKLLMAPNQYMRYEAGGNPTDKSTLKILWCHQLGGAEFASLIEQKIIQIKTKPLNN